MENELEQDVALKTPRARSSQNPGSTIDESIEFVKSLIKVNPSSSAVFNIDSVKNILKSGNFGRDFSAAAQYGLLERIKDEYKVTSLGKTVNAPLTGELILAKKECFKTPTLYKDLIEKYNGHPIPLDDLPIILYRFHGIAEKASKEVAQIFIDNARGAEVLGDDNVLRVGIDLIITPTVNNTKEFVPFVAQPSVITQLENKIETPIALEQINGAEVEKIRLTENKIVVITYPQNLTKKDLLILTKWIEMKELIID